MKNYEYKRCTSCDNNVQACLSHVIEVDDAGEMTVFARVEWKVKGGRWEEERYTNDLLAHNRFDEIIGNVN